MNAGVLQSFLRGWAERRISGARRDNLAELYGDGEEGGVEPDIVLLAGAHL